MVNFGCIYFQQESCITLLNIMQGTVKDYLTQKFRNLRRSTLPLKHSTKLVAIAHAVPASASSSTSLTIEKDDPVSYERNNKMLIAELKRAKPNDEMIAKLIKLTHFQRRQDIQDSTEHTTDILRTYPFFQNKKWVSFFCVII